jgi:hypothetical protein
VPSLVLPLREFSLLQLKNLNVFFRKYTVDSTKKNGDQVLQDAYMSLLEYALSYKTDDQGLKSEVAEEIKYQAEKTHTNFLRFCDKEGWEVKSHDMLAIIVNNGRNGGGNFLICSSILILFFSVFYFGAFRTEISNYILNKSEPTPANQLSLFPVVEKRYKYFLEFSRALWFSVVVFVSPRFDPKFFNLDKRLQILVMIEWVIGILMVIIFVVYIASKYPFLKMIFGG